MHIICILEHMKKKKKKKKREKKKFQLSKGVLIKMQGFQSDHLIMADMNFKRTLRSGRH